MFSHVPTCECGHHMLDHMTPNDRGQLVRIPCAVCGCREYKTAEPIPPEPAIESQVVDGCCPKHGSTWVTDGACRLCRIHNAVNHPPHYTTGSMEVIEAIEGLGLGFHDGNIVKYVARAKHTGSELEDLKKAAWYLSRRIQSLEERT